MQCKCFSVEGILDFDLSFNNLQSLHSLTLYFRFFKKKLIFLSSAIRYLLSNLEALRFPFIYCFVFFFHNNSVGFVRGENFFGHYYSFT